MLVGVIVLCLLLGAWLLWVLAGWASHSLRSKGWRLASLVIVLVCAGLVALGLSHRGLPEEGASRAARVTLGNLVPLCALGLPMALTVGLPQLLLSFGVAPRSARMSGWSAGTVGVILMPFVALIAGCGLAGACL